MNIVLKYIGQGSFIPGIPDRDLTEEDIGMLGKSVNELVKTGLWKKMEQPKPSNKAVLSKYPNKEKS